MPIRLNLLAEAKVAEEMRRKDPVKRAMYVAALSVALMLVWASSLKLNTIVVNKDLNTVVAQMGQATNEYQEVISKQKQVADMTQKLVALHTLTTNRFLNGNLLNALQQTTVEDVQLVRLKLEQQFIFVAGSKARTNSNDKLVPATPPKVTEKTTLVLDGNDASINPGDQVARVREAISSFSYFQEHLDRANPVTWQGSSAPIISPDTGRPTVSFTLICSYPEQTR
jgi:hypothetical protein